MPGQLIDIQNLRGSIVATGGPGNMATVTAHNTAKMSDPSSVSIQVVPYSGGVVFCAIYPDNDPKHPNSCNPPGKSTNLYDNNNDVEVNFTVVVPQAVLLSANTLTGDVQATGLTAHVDARVLEGNITISTSASAQANSSHGSVTAVTGTTQWKGTLSYSARGGNLDLQIPADANVMVEASAFFGSIVSDFPLTIAPTVGGNSTMAHGTIGAGGRVLKLSASNGNIALHKGPPSTH